MSNILEGVSNKFVEAAVRFVAGHDKETPLVRAVASQLEKRTTAEQRTETLLRIASAIQPQIGDRPSPITYEMFKELSGNTQNPNLVIIDKTNEKGQNFFEVTIMVPAKENGLTSITSLRFFKGLIYQKEVVEEEDKKVRKSTSNIGISSKGEIVDIATYYDEGQNAKDLKRTGSINLIRIDKARVQRTEYDGAGNNVGENFYFIPNADLSKYPYKVLYGPPSTEFREIYDENRK